MSSTIDDIATKAIELSRLIQSCPITQRFNESLNSLAGDKNAQRILDELYVYGRNVSLGSSADMLKSAEYQQLKNELDKSPLVKKHLLNQREYLNLLQGIMDRIKNPR